MENTEDNKQKLENAEALNFQLNLQNILITQNNIIDKTALTKERLASANLIIKDQISNFKTNAEKYGKYLVLIKNELTQISETIKKIKKLEKENEAQK